MKNSRDLVLLFIYIFTIVITVCCEDENYFEDTPDNNPDELIDPHSFFYDKQTKKMVDDIQVDTRTDNIQKNDNNAQNEVESSKQTDNYITHEAVFYKRLINLLLSNINVQEENDVTITGTLRIKVSRSQMEILKNFDVHKTSLREVDDILSNMIQKPSINYIAEITDLLDMLQNAFDSIFLTLQQHSNGVMIVCAGLTTCFLLAKMIRVRRLPIFLGIQIILVSSFFMTWWHLLEEAEIKSTAEQMKFASMPLSCQPHKMKSWDRIVSFFSSDDCEQYYRTLMSNSKLKITPAFVLSHFITTIILHPITHMGTVVSDFIRNATAELPFAYAWLVKCILFSCVGFVISMIPFCLFGSSIDLGFGPLLRFGINNHRNRRKGNTFENIENREPVQIILKISQGVEVPQIQNNSEGAQSKALQLTNDACKTITSADIDAKKSYEDLSSGDTVKGSEGLESCDAKKSTEFVTMRTEKEDGSGDS